jgi:tripartite ATP-independent transporter DctM subunit
VSAIYRGFATLVEASAAAVILAIISEGVVHKDLSLKKGIPDAIDGAATLVGAVVILLGLAMGLTGGLDNADVPSTVLDWTRAHVQSPVVFLLVVNAVLLVLGSVLEIYSAIVILSPLLAPLADAYGVDKLHMGIIFLLNLELGFLFPPMGLNLMLSSSRFAEPLPRLYRVTLPFLLIMAGGVLAVTYVPAMTSGFLALVQGAK